MKRAFGLSHGAVLLLFLASLTGCGEMTEEAIEDVKDGPSKTVTAAAGSTVELSPENAAIQFIGRHTDNDDDRYGSFKSFTGKLVIDEEGQPSDLDLDIETESVHTELPQLTTHLKQADFFDVNEYPKATFDGKKIVAKEDGKVEVTGDLTLLETTKSVTFPATITKSGETLEMVAEFDVKRFEFGMTYGEGKVEDVVSIKFMIGKQDSAEEEVEEETADESGESDTSSDDE